MRTIIVEDELHAVQQLQLLCERCLQGIRVVGVASDVAQAQQLLLEQKPDLVFLDMMLGGQNALEALEPFFHSRLQVIVVTGYQEFGIMAIRARVVDYLLKPIDANVLAAAVEVARKRSLANQLMEEEQKIVIKSISGWFVVKPSEIVCAESDGAYTTFHLADKKRLMVTKNIGHVEEILAVDIRFVRVHKSHIVNIPYIRGFTNSRPAQLLMTTGEEVPVSQRKKDMIMQLLASYTTI